jgi:hypothetical protein
MEELLHAIKKFKPMLSYLLNKINNNQNNDSNISVTRQSRSYSDQDDQLLFRKQRNQQIYNLQLDIENLKQEIERKEQLLLELKISKSIVY